jgi:hypothetical protein
MLKMAKKQNSLIRDLPTTSSHLGGGQNGIFLVMARDG